MLDPFAGVGGTLIGAAIAGPPRECVGIEINPRWVQIYRQVVAAAGGALTEYPLYERDSLSLLEDGARFPDGSFQNPTGIDGIGWVITSSPTSPITGRRCSSYASTA